MIGKLILGATIIASEVQDYQVLPILATKYMKNRLQLCNVKQMKYW